MIELDVVGYATPILILLITVLILAAKRPIAYAPVLFLLSLWILLFSAHGLVVTFQFVPLLPSSIDANLRILVALMTIAFSFVFWRNMLLRTIGMRRGEGSLISGFDMEYVIPKPAQWIITAFAFFTFVFMVRTAMTILGTTDVLGSMQLLRTRLNYEGANWGAAGYFVTFVAVFAVYMFTVTRAQSLLARIPTFLTLFCAFGVAILSTQRTSILFLIVAIGFVQSRRGLPSLRAMGILAAIFLGFFISIGFLLGKVGHETDSNREILILGWNSILLYLLTPLSAFSYSEVWINPAADGALISRFVLKALESVDLYTGDIASLVQDFVWVPLPTNVYTFAHMAISDFGSFYIFYYFIIGGILSLVFVFPPRGPAMRTLQAISYYPIVMTVFQDQFFTITSQWLQILIMLFVCRAITRQSSKSGSLSPPLQLARTGYLE